LHHARATGEGQVVDTSMLDSASLMSSVFHSAIAQGSWRDERGVNMTDGGTPYYSVYETSDGRYVSIGALEPQFYKDLIARLGIDPKSLPRQYDQSRWPEIRAALTAAFATKTRDEWVALLEGTDVCFAPVLSFIEATKHRHNVERGGFIENGGVVQPSPAPRLNRSPAEVRPWSYSMASPREVLTSWGFQSDAVTRFVDSGVVRPTDLTTAKEQHVHPVQR
jgi:alpha-methylacyl-CoA racemase